MTAKGAPERPWQILRSGPHTCFAVNVMQVHMADRVRSWLDHGHLKYGHASIWLCGMLHSQNHKEWYGILQHGTRQGASSGSTCWKNTILAHQFYLLDSRSVLTSAQAGFKMASCCCGCQPCCSACFPPHPTAQLMWYTLHRSAGWATDAQQQPAQGPVTSQLCFQRAMLLHLIAQ